MLRKALLLSKEYMHIHSKTLKGIAYGSFGTACIFGILAVLNPEETIEMCEGAIREINSRF